METDFTEDNEANEEEELRGPRKLTKILTTDPAAAGRILNMS